MRFLFRGPPGCEEPLSVLLTDKCRINSFTFLELAEAEGKRSQQSKDNLSVLSDSKSYKRDKDKQVLFQKINEVDSHIRVFKQLSKVINIFVEQVSTCPALRRFCKFQAECRNVQFCVPLQL